MTQPFKVHIEQSVLSNLQDRLAQTRWPDKPQHAGWDYGTNMPRGHFAAMGQPELLSKEILKFAGTLCNPMVWM